MSAMRNGLESRAGGNKNLKGGEMSWGEIVFYLKSKAEGMIDITLSDGQKIVVDHKDISLAGGEFLLIKASDHLSIIPVEKIQKIDFKRKEG